MIQIISDLIKFYSNHRANVTIYEEHFYRATFECFSCMNSSHWKIWTRNSRVYVTCQAVQCSWNKSMHAMRMTSFNLWWWRWKWNKCINIHFIRLQCLRSDPISMALLVFACNKTQLCHHAVWNANESRFVLLIWPQSIANRKSHRVFSHSDSKNRTVTTIFRIKNCKKNQEENWQFDRQ